MTTLTQTQPRLPAWRLPESNWVWPHALPRLETLASGFAPISLAEMDAVALLDRIDTKFVMSNAQLLCALAELQEAYWLLSVSGQRLNHYRTLYFDTPRFDLYAAHVNGRAERYKVRSREYTDSRQSFLEVKHKTRKDRTIKERIPTAQTVMQMTPELSRWLLEVSPLDGSALAPVIWNTFTRLTMVNKCSCERVTLDVDLAFINAERVVPLDGIAVAEVKVNKDLRASPFVAQMRAQRIPRRGFSKFAVGIATLYGGVKKNALKPQLLWIEKMMKGTPCYE